jgi:hypothetical protein
MDRVFKLMRKDLEYAARRKNKIEVSMAIYSGTISSWD